MPPERWLRRATASPRIPIWLVLVALGLVGIRLSRGALLADAYGLLMRPFWPGTAQSEWLRSAQRLDDQTRLSRLESENRRLRDLLGLKGAGDGRRLSAPVISREPGGWWQRLMLGAGSLQGVAPGQAVLAPGGLIGRIALVTPTTATVTLLTDPVSRVGVLVGRNQRQGLLSGIGTDRPLLRFLEKDPQVRAGDVVLTSPASTLVPPDLPVGVIQSVNEEADPAPEAIVQLSAPAGSVDWVQVLIR
jgi:rod shape-determining protein MreC